MGEESVGFGDRKNNACMQGYDDDDDDETGDLSQSFCHSLCSFQEKLLPLSLCLSPPLSSRTMCHHQRDGEGGDDVDDEPLHDRRRYLHFLRPERRTEL